MANVKPGIPRPGPGADASLVRALDALTANVEIITGARGAPLEQLASTAGSADIVAKINEIIGRLNAR